MSILLGVINLTGLVKQEEFYIPINTVIDTANDGSLIIYEKEIKYSPVTLIGGSTWGGLTLSVLNAVKVLASVVGGTYTLTYAGVTSTVRFRMEDIPVISADPIANNRSDKLDTDYYNNIEIKLMEV